MQRHPELARAVALSQQGRNPEAALIINRLAGEGEPGALAMLAEMKWRGGMVPQDLAGARDLFRRAGEAGHPIAGQFYTNLLANGVAGARNWPQALRRLGDEARRDPRRKAALEVVKAMAHTPEGDPAALPAAEEVSTQPEVRLFRHLFTAAECDYLRAAAEPRYEPSMVHRADGSLTRDPIRTSDGATIHWMIEDPAIHALNRRLAAASGTAFEQGEAMQILRYRPGEQYHPHFDFVRASENQRWLTALVWLNADFEGGETHFVKTGLKVRGGKGDAMVFRNMLADRAVDPLSEHEGLPVSRGTKYLVSRWIRETRWTP